MDQKKKHGMWLRPMEPIEKKGNGWLVSMITALSASMLLLLMAGKLTGFDAVYAPWVMLFFAGMVCIVYGIMLRCGRQKWFFPGLLCLLFLLVLILRNWILTGFCLFWNQMGDTFTAGSGWVLKELESPVRAAENSSLFLFSVFAGSIVALLCCMVVSLEKRILAIGIPVLLFTGMIFFSEERAFVYLIPCLLSAICFLVCDGRGKEKQSLAGVVSRWILILCFGALCVSLAAMPKMEDWAVSIGDEIQERLHSSRYETAYTTLPEGDFSDYTETDSTEQTALVVTMEQPEELYLRGFTGAVLEGNTWKALDTKILEENENLLYWLNVNGWNPHSQFSQAVSQIIEKEESKENTKQTITVQNLNACSYYRYVPYTLCEGGYLNAENLNSDGVKADGTRTYLYEVCFGGTETIRTMLESLQQTDTETAEEYRRAEQAYREFVYQYYLDIPQEVTDLLLPYWEETAAAYENVEELTPEQAQACVLDFLERCFSEDGEASEFLLPLSVAEDTSYQYATVVTMTLRYFGIPARYVEGYVITEEMAENAEDGSTVKVDSSQGRAWAEVYQDGIGWLPMEVTPGVEEQPQDTDENTEDGDTPKEKPPKGQELEEEPEDTQEEPEPQGGYVVSIQKMISWTFLLIGLMLLLLLLLLVLRRRMILKRRQKRWEAEDVRDAAGWIFADTAKLLERLGLKRGNGSMWELKNPIEERFGETYAKEYEQMVMVNARAMFSSRELLEEDRTCAKAFYDVTLKYLKENTKWYQRLWMQWVLCLY